MTTFSTDTIINVFQIGIVDNKIGFDSIYTTKPHPGSGKTISPWQWDRRYWPLKSEKNASAFITSSFDPRLFFINDTDWVSGIGQGLDLKLLAVQDSLLEDKRYWIPLIHHGFFFIQQEGDYFYSDSVITGLFLKTGLIQSQLQNLTLSYFPKPTIPLTVKSYYWDRADFEYRTLDNFSKKEEFTGVYVDGVEQSTITGTTYTLANIDTSLREYIFDLTNNKIILNNNYSYTFGTIGDTSTWDLIGTGDGLTNEFHTLYSPIDLAQTVALKTYDPSTGVTTTWTKIDSKTSFTTGASTEYKLDEILGIVTFGDYDPDTTIGAGYIPKVNTSIRLFYTSTVLVRYEPEGTINYATVPESNIDPLYLTYQNGFIKLGHQTIIPESIFLTTSLIENDGVYETSLSNQSVDITVTVLDKNQNPIEGIVVDFEILNPQIGKFTNLETTISGVTNSQGQKTVYFSTPSTINDIGIETQNISFGSGTTTLYVEGIKPPTDLTSVLLFKKMTDDELDDKKILITTTETGINPNTGINSETIVTPLSPTSATQVGSTEYPITAFEYPVTLDYPGFNTITGYFIVAPSQTKIRASVTKPNGGVILSNIITLSVDIPTTSSGLLIINSINEIQSGLLNTVPDVTTWTNSQINAFQTQLTNQYNDEKIGAETFIEWFKRTQRGNTALIGIDPITPTENEGVTYPIKLPIGFRLKTSQIVIASMLDRATFFDVNSLLSSDYFD
jgi:hypothetical protein